MSGSHLQHSEDCPSHRIKQTMREGALNMNKTDNKEVQKPLIIEVEPLVRKIGNTTYTVNAFSSPNARVDLVEKMRQLILNDNAVE